MIFRALFWIGLIALLMPHEPDLGLGRPDAKVQKPSFLASFQMLGLRSLDEVRADLQTNSQHRGI